MIVPSQQKSFATSDKATYASAYSCLHWSVDFPAKQRRSYQLELGFWGISKILKPIYLQNPKSIFSIPFNQDLHQAPKILCS